MTSDFTTLDLRPELVQTLVEKGYTAPTPIQSDLIPAMLNQLDVIGQSQTGSGKTAAFGLPMLHSLQKGRGHVQGLVMAPTRELAIQVADAISQYGRRVKVRVLAIYGGQPYGTQISRLRKGVDIVVGTPGRLLDLIRRNALDLAHLSTVVLDEADEMLSMGFIADIEAILEKTPAERQTALFSATMSRPILRLAGSYLRDPHTFTMKEQKRTVSSVEQRSYLVNGHERLAALTRLFEAETIVSALVFARTRVSTGELASTLAERGFQAEVLNGDLGQEAREKVLQRFRDNRIKVLVATDVAARGLDIDHVSHVFNYELPPDPEVYVHRIGRTGRAGRSGVAISLHTPGERWMLKKVESYTRQKMTPSELPTETDIQQQRDQRLVERLMVWLRRGRCSSERKMVAGLVAEGHEMDAIAAAALKLVRVEEKQRPIAPISEVRQERPRRSRPAAGGRSRTRDSRRNRPAAFAGDRGRARESISGGTSHEKGMVRISLSSGRNDGLDVRHIVGSLSHHADIPGHCIGRIDIQHQATFVDVPEKVVDQVLAKADSYRIGRQRIRIARA